jgi:hypothetical protein
MHSLRFKPSVLVLSATFLKSSRSSREARTVIIVSLAIVLSSLRLHNQSRLVNPKKLMIACLAGRGEVSPPSW